MHHKCTTNAPKKKPNWNQAQHLEECPPVHGAKRSGQPTPGRAKPRPRGAKGQAQHASNATQRSFLSMSSRPYSNTCRKKCDDTSRNVPDKKTGLSKYLMVFGLRHRLRSGSNQLLHTSFLLLMSLQAGPADPSRSLPLEPLHPFVQPAG